MGSSLLLVLWVVGTGIGVTEGDIWFGQRVKVLLLFAL